MFCHFPFDDIEVEILLIIHCFSETLYCALEWKCMTVILCDICLEFTPEIVVIRSNIRLTAQS